MRLVVRLAGEAIPWRYKDTDRLGNWLDDRPWVGRPVADVVRVAAPAAAAHTLAAVRDAVAAADRGATGVEVFDLDPGAAAAGGFAHAAAGFLGADPGRPATDLARLLARHLADRPIVWLVPPTGAGRPQLLGETEAFLDLLAKLDPTARTVVVFADTPGEPLTGRCFDLATGGPAVSSDLLTVPEARAWPQYVHRRLAWEAGGNLPRAERLSRAVEEAWVRPDDDAGLERALTRAAVAMFAELPYQQQVLAEAGVTACVSRSGAGVTGSDLFWSPWQVGSPAPAPWVSRALLSRDPDRPHAEFVRGSLLCLPLAQELLAACFLMETHIRGRVRLPPQPQPGAACLELWRKFQVGGGFGAALYPAGCPASPVGPWAFASLGEVLASEVARPPDGEWRHEVRELRNHLAHGHHAGWESVRLARRLMGWIVR